MRPHARVFEFVRLRGFLRVFNIVCVCVCVQGKFLVLLPRVLLLTVGQNCPLLMALTSDKKVILFVQLLYSGMVMM